MLKSVFFILSVICLSSVLNAQRLDNKVIPVELQGEIVEALSHFSPLDSFHIVFKYRKTLKNRVMQAQPKISTIFNGKKKRKYKITMSRRLTMNDTVMMIDQLPFDILVGWFAHELGHIMDYKDRSAINLIGFAFHYLTSTPFLKKSEKRADLLAVSNGCANNLIKTKRYILFTSKFTKEYKAKIKALYPSPQEITAMIDK